MSLIGLLILILIVGSLLWLARRLFGSSSDRRYQPGNYLPQSAPAPGRTARLVEAVVLAAAATIIFAVALARSSGGLFSMDHLRPLFAMVNIIIFVCAVAGAAAAVILALRGKTVAGTLIMTMVLFGYCLSFYAGEFPGACFFPKRMVQPVVTYKINIGGSNVAGAELWVNGVYLGKTPYATTLDEFTAKVPFWPQPPADYDTDVVHAPRYDPTYESTSQQRRWIKFGLPDDPYWPEKGESPEQHQGQKTYYARVRYGGEWGLGTGHYGSGGANDQVESGFDVVFPERQKRLDALLNQARLSDYRVSPEWFKAIETFREDGWLALRTAADKEPRMMEVLDAWAGWRYGLDRATDADSAWLAFQRICDEADAERQYLTPSVAGRAVELLVPKLPQDRLLDRAVAVMRHANSIGYFKWQANGRLQFGYSQRPSGVNFGGEGNGSNNFSGGQPGAKQFPMSGFAVAHAVWMLSESRPDLVQQRIVPELVRWQYANGLPDPMLAAAHLGGPALDKFLLRQNWQAPGRFRDDNEYMGLGMGHEVNKWLYLLAWLNDDAGREFRHQYASNVMDMADSLYQFGPFESSTANDFIFHDPALAKEYWPRFARLTRQKDPHYALETQWRFLKKMGAQATPAMYLEAWKETPQIEPDMAFQVLDDLDPKMSRAVAEAVINFVRQDDSNLKSENAFIKHKDMVSQALAHLEGVRSESRKTNGLDVLKILREGDPATRQRLRQGVPLWLAHTQPYSPLVETLARSDDPSLRLLVIPVLRECPTPPHQQLLEQLSKDSDSTVQAAAKNVAADLKVLAAEPPLRYVSDSPRSTP